MIINCPECKNRVSTMAGTCPHCGIQIAGNLVECPHCHEYNFSTQTECNTCHGKLESQHTPIEEEKETNATERTNNRPTKSATKPAPRKRKRRGCFWFFLTLALLTSLAAAFYYWQEEAKKAKEETEYRLLKNVTNPAFYQQFLNDHPGSKYTEQVKRSMQRLEAENAEWQEVLKVKTRIQFLKFMQNHPQTHHKRECEDFIDSIDWADATNIGTLEAYAHYLELHPSGAYAEMASGTLNELAKTRITKEEKVQILGLINTFFAHGLARQDTLAISTHMPPTMNDFCGTKQATPTQIAEFNKEKRTEDVLGIHYVIPGEINFKRETLEDGTMGFAVDLIVEETINRSDATQPSHRTLQVNAWLNNEKKIVRMNIK